MKVHPTDLDHVPKAGRSATRGGRNNMDPIEIHEYSEEWPKLFQALGARLRKALGDVALRIDHIGSTSIRGLAAKPIIDVQISVEKLEPVDPFRISLEHLGFVWRQNNPELTKRYFREKPGERRTHIHVRRAGSWSEQFALLFRDYLREHVEDQRRYERFKRELAEKYRNDRMKYTDGKNPVFWEIMFRADRWEKRTGWAPGPSDA
jgi:GrpB-like predicted nucleotidyltransferase (UPF0157 family)